VPVYSYARYEREPWTDHVEPQPVIILEGILVLENAALRELLDIKLYVDTDADVRFIRRLLRDTKERGRTVESVVSQYMDVVRPMHLQFVEPTKRYADLIIPEGGFNLVAIDVIVSKLRHFLNSVG
jgi:uridine kinase